MSESARALLRRLAALRAAAAELVERRSADDPAAHDPLRGLYVSRESALRAGSSDGPDPARAPDGEARAETEPDPGEAGQDLGVAGQDRLSALVRDFGLSALDLRILLAAAAPDVDRRFEPLYGYLNDDVGRRRASVALALELAGSGPQLPRARGRFHVAAPLIAGGLLGLEDEDRPLPGRALRVPERVVAHLLGDDSLDEALCRAGVTLLPPAPRPAYSAGTADAVGSVGSVGSADTADAADTAGSASTAGVTGSASVACGAATAVLVARSRRPVTVHLRERHGAASAASVVTALRAAGRPVLLYRAGPGAPEPAIGALLRREARLRGAGTAVVVTALPGDPGGLISSIAAPDITSVFAGPEPYDPDWAAGATGVSLLALDAPAPGAAAGGGGSGGGASVDRWRAVLPGFDGEMAKSVASYRLDGEQIEAVARAARELAAFEGVALGAHHVRHSARRLSAPLLGRHARQVRPAVGFADLVLPEPPRSRLVELVGRARHRDEVLGGWRLRTGGGRGRGVVALFAGPSGTGKTLAAEVVAGELGLDLYVVDLSSVVDKYVGETEKNLERIFVEADRTDAVLLFDEADAVFGKRSQVRGSNDRYANMESAYLLQRLESFDGIAVLTTNLRSNLDEAFTRRLDLVVDFPFPDAELRASLWRGALAGAPTEPGVEAELKLCAAEFELAGGSIRSAALTACYAARVRGDGPVTAEDVRDGARREYVKAGRLVPDSTGAWSP
ncbi:ATP-binding protein [Streptomyces sp. H27-S2]|uniref:ATP-binding protein n=1 Tax=Streptomyces antarcticus TaxID=2996458 RepID=UPI00226EE2D4|nr:AAA family ATPase [Streptomyces sp. H27-S2]MCY0954182.1 AAA family ATPase [Streptomyces sp. H27-S2]